MCAAVAVTFSHNIPPGLDNQGGVLCDLLSFAVYGVTHVHGKGVGGKWVTVG